MIDQRLTRRLPTLGFIGLMMAVLAGCESSSTTTVGDSVRSTGFLSDYSRLRRGEEGQAISVYWNDTVDFAPYTKMLIEPVTIWATPETELIEVPADERQELANAFHEALVVALKDDFEIVSVRGPNTIRLRVALTEAVASNPVLDTVSTYVPQARLVSTVLTLGSETKAFVGQARAEGEARDALTGKLLAAGIDQRAGTKALGDDTFDSWGDVKKAFTTWAERFRDNLRARRSK
ncbi:MAG: DUF3313 domain-containing protein [Paracoccaceae bacterium]|nr:DUF3313 domain-containing protein [Paracoccaceae bacterium]